MAILTIKILIYTRPLLYDLTCTSHGVGVAYRKLKDYMKQNMNGVEMG